MFYGKGTLFTEKDFTSFKTLDIGYTHPFLLEIPPHDNSQKQQV
jgi:hypothetical protein